MGTIHLIRHGITEAVNARVYYGDTDLPLTNEGIDGISDLTVSGVYPKADGAELFTSGLLRTEQTFFLIYGCREHRTLPELREYNFGEFEMKTHDQLTEDEAYQAWIRDDQGLTPCPGGESRKDFRDRIKAGFSEILERYKNNENRDKTSIVVCHGGVISLIMGLCFPEEQKNMFQWVPDPGRGYSIHMDGIEPVSFDEL